MAPHRCSIVTCPSLDKTGPPARSHAIGDEARRKAGWLLAALRRNGVSADMDYMGRSLRKAMQVAGRSARYAALLGPDELAQDTVKVKDLASGEETAVKLAAFATDPCSFLSPIP